MKMGMLDIHQGLPRITGFTRGAIVGQGKTYTEALKDTESAIRFFIRHYGKKKFSEHLESETPTIEAFIAETSMAI